MKRCELGIAAMQELKQRNGVADEEWIASLLDRAIATGHEEVRGRVERALGPFVVQLVTRADRPVTKMKHHMFVRYS